MTKKILLVWLAALCALAWTLTGCGQKEPSATVWTTGQMAEAILASQGGQAAVEQAAFGEDSFEAYLTNYYHLNPENVSDGTILYAGGTSALEIAVLQLAGEEYADGALEILRAYIEDRTGAFTGYLPEQAAVLEQSSAVSRGPYVALLICGEQSAARKAFDSSFEGAEPPEKLIRPKTEEPPEESGILPQQPADVPEAVPDTPEDAAADPGAENPSEDPAAENGQEAPDEPPPENDKPAAPQETEGNGEPAAVPEPEQKPEPAPEPEPEEAPSVQEESGGVSEPEPEGPWSYDRNRLLTAWSAGDWSGLHKRDREILDACSGVFQSVIRDGMTDYAKELAVHDWMIDWGSYDSDTLNHQQGAEPNPDHDNPYGFLIGKKGICLGYTSTFQLMMDMLGIECITVSGITHNGTADHAWNMVRLDGEWYCVDVTWDDPTTYNSVPRNTAHKYFNVTSDFLRQCDHQWDETSVSEATAVKWAWNWRE